MEILKIHSNKITKHGDIDYEAVVKLADNFNGADLRNICTEAGMFAIRWAHCLRVVCMVVVGGRAGSVGNSAVCSALLPSLEDR